MAKLKISKTPTGTDLNVTYPQATNSAAGWTGVDDAYVSPILVNGSHIGGTGGNTSITGQQIQPQVYINKIGGSSLPGSIIAQKGSHKFEVTDGTLVGKCTLTNSPNLTAGQMNILINLNTAAANIAAANVAGGATSTTVTYDTRTTVTGPLANARVGDYFIWTSPSANIGGVAQVTGSSNGTFTISTSGNVAAATGVTLTTSTYASRIDNKYVRDFYSDGNQDSTSGTVTYYTSGYNPTKWRYHLAAPTSTFVQVQSA
jgi:hypothetical protein